MSTLVITVAAVLGIMLTVAGVLGVWLAMRTGQNTQTVRNFRDAAESWREKAEALGADLASLQGELHKLRAEYDKLKSEHDVLKDVVSGKSAIEALGMKVDEVIVEVRNIHGAITALTGDERRHGQPPPRRPPAG